MKPSQAFLRDLHAHFHPQGIEIISHFFMVFSRFEEALKASMAYATPHDGRVGPDWDAFVNAIQPQFNPTRTPELSRAVTYLLDNPPLVQHRIGNAIVWQPRTVNPAAPEVHRLKDSIRDLRNNLFHGGKFYGDFDPVQRNATLLQNGMVVLDEWLLLNTLVRDLFLRPLG